MSLGFTEILLIVVVVLLLFGAKRIPELAKALGRASNEYKKAKDELAREGRELADAAGKAAEAEDAKKDAKPDAPAPAAPADGPSAHA
jgi:sec-independent protein translocase protein TatA